MGEKRLDFYVDLDLNLGLLERTAKLSVSRFLVPKIVDGVRPCSGKILLQRSRPPLKTAELYTFRLTALKP